METEFSNFTVATYGGLQTIAASPLYPGSYDIRQPGPAGSPRRVPCQTIAEGVISQIIYISSVPLLFCTSRHIFDAVYHCSADLADTGSKHRTGFKTITGQP